MSVKSNQLVNTVDLNNVIPILNIGNKANRTINLIGKQGIGKSQIVRQYADQYKFDGVIDLRLGQMEVGDLVGLPAKVQQGKDWVTVWARPCWWPTGGRYVIFLDEWNRAATLDVIQAIFQLILDRKLHTNTLPDGCQVICAMNPSDKGFMVNKIKDKALWDRMVHLNVVPTDREFFDWARKSKLQPDLLDFVKVSPAVLGDRIFNTERREPSPRAIEMLSDLYKACTNDEWEQFGSTLAAGTIGTEFGVQFIKFLADRNYKPLSAEEVFNDLEKHTDKIKKWTDPSNLRLDVLNGTLDNMKAWINAFESQDALDKAYKTKAKTAELDKYRENHIKFCSMLPSDLIAKHISELVNTKALLHSIKICDELVKLLPED